MSAEPADSQIPRCLNCDYALVGLTSPRCPECGRDYDPNDQTTFRTGDEIGIIGKILLSQPGRNSYVICAVSAIALLIGESVPNGYPIPEFLGMFFLVVIFLAWFLRVSLYAIAKKYFTAHSFSVPNTRRRAWIYFPVVFVIVVCLLTVRAPLWLTFAISRPFMERVASEQLQNPKRERGPRWLGLYRAREIQPVVGGMEFRVTGSLWGGFAYLPEIRKLGSVPPGRERFYGNWYLVDFRSDFGD